MIATKMLLAIPHKDFVASMLLVWTILGMFMLAGSIAHATHPSLWKIRVGSVAWFGWLAATVGSALVTFGPIYFMTLL